MSRLDTIHQNHSKAKTNEYGTPIDFFNKLNKEFNFTLDPASTHENAKCDKHYTLEDNGLIQDWGNEIVFCNPPYSGRNTLKQWVVKGYKESLKGATVVLLIPVRTDSGWWHDYCMKGEIRFIRGRLKFTNMSLKKNAHAPFAVALVIFRGGTRKKENGK